MNFSLGWMPDVLLQAGLKVALVEGWLVRGRAEMGQLRGVMCHHTAGPRSGNMPSLKTLIEGRSDLPGPLSQLGVGRDGTFYVIAAGRCNHAGKGIWQGISNGNSHFISIEAENTGRQDDQPWPEIQMRAMHAGVAALLKRMGLGADACVGHKEYALPKGRKPDPSFDMIRFRESVAGNLMSGLPPLPLIPAHAPLPATGEAERPTLRRGARGEAVVAIQTAIGSARVDGVFDSHLEAEIRAFQRAKGLIPDGIVGPKTWALVDAR
jgi:hypothetical protein